MKKVIALVGPTAVGKSDLAIDLALKIDGEVINADAMQLYQDLDIATAKVPLSDRKGVVHHLLDIYPVSK
ncbi:MAG: isopentenyl transferase family protein, partial [Candidatus Nanopelagicales bacterium]